jgi:hypothetical protein
MSEEFQQTRVTFNCGGVELAGCYLYRLADATGKRPCVVMGHGYHENHYPAICSTQGETMPPVVVISGRRGACRRTVG